MSNKATPRFELGIKALQASALPLGHVAVLDIIEQNFRICNTLFKISDFKGMKRESVREKVYTLSTP